MKIKEVLTYTRENTGAHFLDSGGAYGRIYNSPRPTQLLTMTEYGGRISVTHWIAENADYHKLNKTFKKWRAQPKNNKYNDFEAVPAFMEWAANQITDEESCIGNYKQVARDNTCNQENDFDQDFVYEIWELEGTGNGEWYYNQDNCVVVIYAHTGCDVRGGYARPLLLKFHNGDYTMPLDFQCGYYIQTPEWDAPEKEYKEALEAKTMFPLTDEEQREFYEQSLYGKLEAANERLTCGYSSWPFGELEKLVTDIEEIEGTDDYAKGIFEGVEVKIYPDLYIC